MAAFSPVIIITRSTNHIGFFNFTDSVKLRSWDECYKTFLEEIKTLPQKK